MPLTMKNKKICIVASHDLRLGARHKREILVLKRYGYDIVEIGPYCGTGIEGVRTIIIPPTQNFVWYKSWWNTLFSLRRKGEEYKKDHWNNYKKSVFDLLEIKEIDLYIAHDLEVLPLVTKLRKKTGGMVLFNSHDYQPLQFEERWYWKYFVFPFIDRFFKKYLSCIDYMITVSDSLADKYYKEYGIRPTVVRNFPFYYSSDFKKTDPDRIRIIYHGIAARERRLEDLIKLMEYVDQRYELNLMLFSEDIDYIQGLKKLAGKICPQRVNFRDSVEFDNIISTINNYDIGIMLYRPDSFKLKTSLPNKLFESIMAGNCIIGGVSEEMGKIINKYNCGVYINKIDYKVIAKIINNLTTQNIDSMKLKSLTAAKELNAENEMKAFMDIVEKATA